MKTLRVCLSSELPDLLERNPDFLYFTYDKLFLYSGQNLLDVNFVITHEIPDSQVIGLIYILDTDGSVHRKFDYVDEKIAEIEDESQIELLKKAGTMYYIDANHRYMDSQRRTLTLPYNNGNYELTVAAKNDAVFNNNTILKYNEKNNRFEMFGEQDEEFIDYSKPFRGKETNSVKVNVDGPKISAKIKISNSVGNILKLASDGLYVKPLGWVDSDIFEKWSNDVSDFKKYAQNILDRIDAEIADVEQLVTKDAIHKEVMDQLEPKYPTIDTAIENYQQIVDSLDDIEAKVLDYSSTSIHNAYTNIDNKLEENSAWDNLDDSHNTYKHEVDYYNKAEKYYYPELTKTMKLNIIATAIDQYLQEEENKKAIIGIAISKYFEEEN